MTERPQSGSFFKRPCLPIFSATSGSRASAAFILSVLQRDFSNRKERGERQEKPILARRNGPEARAVRGEFGFRISDLGLRTCPPSCPPKPWRRRIADFRLQIAEWRGRRPAIRRVRVPLDGRATRVGQP